MDPVIKTVDHRKGHAWKKSSQPNKSNIGVCRTDKNNLTGRGQKKVLLQTQAQHNILKELGKPKHYPGPLIG